MRALLLALLLLAPLAASPLVSAYPDPAKVPTYYPSACYEEHTKRFVHDYLGIVPEEYGVEMEGAACEIYRRTSAHFVLLTVPDTEDETLEMYAANLFEAWGIGDRDLDNGILLMYVNDYLHSGESALRIEVGYGLEPVVNSIVTEEAWDLMIGARDEALAAGEDATSARVYAMAMGMAYLLAVIRESYSEAGAPAPDPAPANAGPYRRSVPDDDGGGRIFFTFVVILFVILIIHALSRKAQGNTGWGYHGPSSPGWSTPSTQVWIPPSAYSGGGSFGGGSLGGGSSGGGDFGGSRSGGGSFGGGQSGGGGRGGKF